MTPSPCFFHLSLIRTEENFNEKNGIKHAKITAFKTHILIVCSAYIITL